MRACMRGIQDGRFGYLPGATSMSHVARRRIIGELQSSAAFCSGESRCFRNNPVQNSMGNALSNTVEWVATCGASADRDVLVVIDPISTGAVLASQAVERGLAIIAVWSESVPEELKGYVDKRLSLRYIGVVQHMEGKLKATARAVRAIGGERIKGVLVGCETGVLLGDALAEELGQRGNGTKLSPLRRNKWLQTEAVRESGANACIQSLVTGMSQVSHDARMQPIRARPCTAPTRAYMHRPAIRVHTDACIHVAGRARAQGLAHDERRLQGGGEAVRGRGLGRRDHLQLEAGRARRLPQAGRHAQRPWPHHVRGTGAGVPRGRRVRGGQRLTRRCAQVRRHLEVRQENLQRLARRLLRRAPLAHTLQPHAHALEAATA